MPSCYYYDEQRNRCNCYVNENLNELLAENAKLQASNEVIAEDHVQARGGGMTLEWYEWECPHCRRIGQVNPASEYEDGETIRMKCPVCGREVVVLCDYQPTFLAYRPKNWEVDG